MTHIQKTDMFFLLLLLLFNSLAAEETITILAKVSEITHGETVVYEFPQTISVVAVQKNDITSISLQVATATKDLLSRENFQSWLEWYKQGAPGASSIEQIDFHNGKVFPEENSSWLQTLLTLPLYIVPEENRKRAGPQPMPGEHDLRPIWQPKVVIKNRDIATKSTAYICVWPKDTSSFSERKIILYFPQSSEAVSSFPYWIESPSSRYNIKVINSLKSTPNNLNNN